MRDCPSSAYVDLDNVIDGMRKVAMHVDIYKPIVAPLRSDALELFAVGERIMGGVRELITPDDSAMVVRRIHRREDWLASKKMRSPLVLPRRPRALDCPTEEEVGHISARSKHTVHPALAV